MCLITDWAKRMLLLSCFREFHVKMCLKGSFVGAWLGLRYTSYCTKWLCVHMQLNVRICFVTLLVKVFEKSLLIQNNSPCLLMKFYKTPQHPTLSEPFSKVRGPLNICHSSYFQLPTPQLTLADDPRIFCFGQVFLAESPGANKLQTAAQSSTVMKLTTWRIDSQDASVELCTPTPHLVLHTPSS